RTAGARLVPDDALDGLHVAKAPELETLFDVDQFFAHVVGVPPLPRIFVDRLEHGHEVRMARVRLREIAVDALRRDRQSAPGEMGSSAAHCSNSCFWMSFTRARILKQGSSASARTWTIAALSSWIRSLIHNSDTWCWMMNSISSCRGGVPGPPESGRCASSS